MTDRPAIHMTKAQTAEWMGYGADVASMDVEHDLWHLRLCEWLGVESCSLLEASGVELDERQKRLAEIEEDAVLNLQRFVQMARNEGVL